MTYVDVDSLLRRVYGKATQGAGFGHTRVGGYRVLLRGLSPLIATLSTPVGAPVIAAARLRGGSAGSARGAASLVAAALAVAREVGAAGLVAPKHQDMIMGLSRISSTRYLQPRPAGSSS